MSDTSQEQNNLKPSEKLLPPDSDFLHHRIKPGEKRSIGFSMFQEYYITYSNQDEQLLANQWQNISAKPDSYQEYISQLSDSALTKDEISFIAQVAATIVNLNGRQIGEEDVANRDQLGELDKKRLRAYENTDIGKVVSLSDIQGKGFVMCAEASLIGQGLSQYCEGYHVASATVVSRADTKSAEGHELNFLISDDENRVILFDVAYGVIKEVNGKKILIPWVTLLTTSQVADLEKGKNVSLEAMGEKRAYRIGTPHTPSGTWKTQLIMRNKANLLQP